MHLRAEDAGSYTVRAVNRLGEAISSATLRVFGESSVSRLFSECLTSSIRSTDLQLSTLLLRSANERNDRLGNPRATEVYRGCRGVGSVSAGYASEVRV